ncbi:MAG: menaquinone biosynthesis protein [Chitinophagaceae bacterium]
MNSKIRIGAVSYLNTKPFLYGLEQKPFADRIELIQDYPANLSSLLQKDKIDIALLPVVAIKGITDASIISDYCIGSESEVASVCLYSEVPIEEIQTILLDYQSRTSVALLKILLDKYWQTRPMLLEANENFISDIKDKTAGLVIGDRALALTNTYPYVYDLAACWNEYTRLPFVFATWVANKKINEAFIKDFNSALQVGLENIDKIIENNTSDHYDLAVYYKQNISFELDEKKKNAMTLFLKLIELM